MKNKITNAVTTGGKITAAVAILGSIAEAGFLGARMLINDGKCVVKTLLTKKSHIVYRRRGPFRQLWEYDTITKTYIKKVETKSKKTKK